ncbi:MAG: hypothetical protein ACPGJV_13690 [Bacteriovoracaceae bacterium]
MKCNFIKPFCLTALLFLCSQVKAEYRVYLYLIKTNNFSHTLESTLSPTSYKAYHGGQGTNITLLKTWSCPGYTGKGTPICPSPENKLLRRLASKEESQ